MDEMNVNVMEATDTAIDNDVNDMNLMLDAEVNDSSGIGVKEIVVIAGATLAIEHVAIPIIKRGFKFVKGKVLDFLLDDDSPKQKEKKDAVDVEYEEDNDDDDDDEEVASKTEDITNKTKTD